MLFNGKVSSQNFLDKFLEQEDSSIYLTTSLRNSYLRGIRDTIVNGVKLKKISTISGYYYGEIEIKDGKISGNQPPVFISLNDCNPCYLCSYRSDGTLYDEGIYKTDCPLGLQIKYFPSGKIAIATNYTPDTTGESCSVLDGETSYFNYNGDKILSEFYRYDKLIQVVPYNLSISGTVKFSIENKLLLINDTLKLYDFRKIIIQPDTNQNAVLKNGFNASIRVYQKKKLLETFYYDLKSLNDSAFIAELKQMKINLNQEIHIQFTLMLKEQNEFIETHYFVFQRNRRDKN